MLLGAWAVADNKGWTVVALGFLEGLDGLHWVGAKGDLGDIDVSIGHGHESEVLLGFFLTGSGELVDGTGLGGLGSLTAGVGVNLSVEDKDVDVGFVGKDVIESAIADIEGPAVTTDDPDGFVDKVTVVVLEFFDGFVFGSFDGFDEVFDKSALGKSILAFKGSDVLGGKLFELWLDFAFHGGFEDTEIDEALNAGFETITLGKRILRTETAGMYLMSVLSYLGE